MKKLLGVLLVSLAAFGGWRLLLHSSDDGGRPADLVNRVWLDQMPARDTDFVEALVLLREGGDNLGIFVRTSQWKAVSEVMIPRDPGGHTLELLYPQTQEREQVRWSITPCREGQFTTCLTLRGNSRGVQRYRSNDELKLEGGARLGPTKNPAAGVQAVQELLRRALTRQP